MDFIEGCGPVGMNYGYHWGCEHSAKLRIHALYHNVTITNQSRLHHNYLQSPKTALEITIPAEMFLCSQTDMPAC